MELSRSLSFLIFVLLQQKSSPLHVFKELKRTTSHNCQMVLTKNLECPSIGSYPVAGTCEYFSRCMQTPNGVESQVEFCPVGEVYVSNRCQRADDPNDCPQRYCSLTKGTVQPPPKTIFPDAITVKPVTTTTVTSVTEGQKKKSKPNKPLLDSLHPTKNYAVHHRLSIFSAFLLVIHLVL